MTKLATAAGLALCLAVLLHASPLEACSCSHTCNEKLCPGGCQISLPDPCGCSCSGAGCDYRCRGSGSITCREANEVGTCPNGVSPQAGVGCASGDTRVREGWAVLEYWIDREASIDEGDISVLAASDPSFGQAARRDVASLLNGEASLARAKAARSGEPPVRGEPLRYSMLFHGGHASQSGRRATIRITSDTAPSTVSSGTRAYVRGRTDQSGRVTDVELLYSPSGGAGDLANMIRRMFVLRSDGAPVPLDFYGYVGVFDGGRIGYALSSYVAHDGVTRP